MSHNSLYFMWGIYKIDRWISGIKSVSEEMTVRGILLKEFFISGIEGIELSSR